MCGIRGNEREKNSSILSLITPLLVVKLQCWRVSASDTQPVRPPLWPAAGTQLPNVFVLFYGAQSYLIPVSDGLFDYIKPNSPIFILTAESSICYAFRVCLVTSRGLQKFI